MQRKPGLPLANCNIRMPETCQPAAASIPPPEMKQCEEDSEHQQKRQQLINFGHSQWGFNNWNWTVTRQDLDFVDYTNGKYSVGVAAFVSITVKNLDLHRENVGYATSVASSKGFAIYKSRKCAVTNALRETLLSFGGSVATELMELMETTQYKEFTNPVTAPELLTENNQNLLNKPVEPKNSPLKNLRKDSADNIANPASNLRSLLPMQGIKNAVLNPPPPVAKAHPMPANLPPAANRPPQAANAPRPPPPTSVPPHIRPNPNEVPKTGLEGLSEEEARVERKRRQRIAQEEFRYKQILKQKTGLDDNQELNKNSSSFDKLLMDIPTQDIVIEETGACVVADAEAGKRKSPALEGSAVKRRASINKLNILTD